VLRLDGYEIGERLRFAEKTQVYTAVRESDGLPVIIKIHPRDYSSREHSQAQYEFDILSGIVADGVPQAIEVHRDGERPALILEQLPGVNLNQFSHGEALQVGLFLDVAQQLVRILAEIHRAGVIHLDLKPSNIMLDPTDLHVGIIDFGIAVHRHNTASSQPQQAPTNEASEAGELHERGLGTLGYIAPEQTGRMERDIDRRSDLYSLGVVFYELLTGRLPFLTQDPLELIHAHIAQVPAPIDQLESGIPSGLARLVSRLLEKEPERRYQSCEGLIADLERCAELWRTTGDIPSDLDLGNADAPAALHFDDRLFGRDEQRSELEANLSNTIDGRSGLVVISGPPGIGKSSLARALLPKIRELGGRFIEGQFDAYRADQPLRAFAVALADLAEQLLSGDAAELEALKNRLHTALGGIASVVVELIPELAPLFPNAPPAPTLGPEQTRRRLLVALRRFLSVFGNGSEPLVILLEDIHYADTESITLLEEILLAPDQRSTLILATLRDIPTAEPASDGSREGQDTNRVRALRCKLIHEQLTSLVDKLATEGKISDQIRLGPLAEPHIEAWIRELLGFSASRAARFCARLRHRTGGIPFLIRQYVLHLVDLNLIERRTIGTGWTFDDDALEAAAIPEDIANLLTRRLRALPEAQRRLLETASFLDDVLDRAALLELCGLDEVDFDELGRELTTAGLLVGDRDELRFAHRRIREEAHNLGTEEGRAEIHYEIGHRLLRSTDPAWLPLVAAEIVEHLNQAPPPQDQEERKRRIELNLMAGNRALGRGNPSIADRFLSSALQSFGPDDWEAMAPIAFDLHYQGAEAAFANSRGQRALELLGKLQLRPLDPVQTALVFGRKANIRVLVDDVESGLQEGIAGLKRVGWSWPSSASRVRLYYSILEAWWNLHRFDPERPRADMSEMPPSFLASSILLSHIAAACYRNNIPMFAYAVSSSLKIHRRFALPMGFGLVGFSVAHLQAFLTGNYARAYEIGQRARMMSEREATPRFKALLLINEHVLINPWVKHRRSSLAPLRQAERIGQEIGEIEHTVYAAFYQSFILYMVGDPLSEVMRSSREMISRYQNVVRSPLNEVLLPAFETLAGDRAYDPDEPNRSIESAEVDLAPLVTAVWMGLLYFLREYDRLLELGVVYVDKLSHTPRSEPFVPEYWFFLGLGAAAKARQSGGRQRRRLLRLMRRSMRRMRHFARFGPDNFLHQQLLLEAEHEFISGRPTRALPLYGQAAEVAQDQSYHHHAALAYERRAEWCLEANLPRDASSELGRAMNIYATWGAKAKIAQLQRDYKELLQDYPIHSYAYSQSSDDTTNTSQVRSTRGTRGRTDRGDAHSLDMTALLRASEALSGELKFESVLDRIMSLAIETAGAQRACLLLSSGDLLRLEAERDADRATVRHPHHPALDECANEVPVSVIRYVQHAHKTKVIGKANSDRLFKDDPYIRANDSKSILVVPILRQTHLVGVLYLENSLVPNAFSTGSVDVLGLLSTHAAISIHNARLYDELRTLNLDLEKRVEERTLELRSARDAAQSADRAKGEFLAVMSHEIRTPMNVVIGMAQLLEETSLESDQRECVQAVRTASNSLLALINDILDFSKIEAGKLELEAIPFSLRECVEEVVEILTPKAYERELELPVWIDRRLPDQTIGDPVRIKQVLINFVNNAIKFTERGQVSIQLRIESDELVRVDVEDTGIGIPADRIDRLFQRFSQVDVSTTRKFGGTGLGLAISKGLIDAMQGEVGVSSTLGVGSTFWFELPLRPVPIEEAKPNRLDLRDRRIAIVLDHEPSAAGLREQLLKFGGDARIYTPEQALVELEPGTDALVFVRYPLGERRSDLGPWLAAWNSNPNAHVIAMPSLHARPDAESSLEGKVSELLTWPVKLSNLEHALRRCLGLSDPSERALPKPESAPAIQAERGQIIVAEDYPLNQKLIVRLLKRFGFECDVVENGQLLVEATAARHYDLALVDCQMPILDGFEATRTIRERERQTGERLAIVAMTANAMKGDRELCLDSGMDDYLSKPIHLEALQRVLSKYLDAAATPAS